MNIHPIMATALAPFVPTQRKYRVTCQARYNPGTYEATYEVIAPTYNGAVNQAKMRFAANNRVNMDKIKIINVLEVA